MTKPHRNGMLVTMTIRLDNASAKNRFSDALELAKSNEELPVEWLESTRKISESPSRTFIAMLGTELLAKATDPRVDTFALKVRAFPNAYSARALGKDVVVPACVEAWAFHLISGLERRRLLDRICGSESSDPQHRE